MTISFILGDTGVIPPALEIVDGAFRVASIDCTSSHFNHPKMILTVHDLEIKVKNKLNVADKSYNVNENEHKA